MPNHARWYDNPDTGLPTIRRSPGARQAVTPDQVRAWMRDGALERAAINHPIQDSQGSAGALPLGEDDEGCDHCPTCGQSTDEEAPQ